MHIAVVTETTLFGYPIIGTGRVVIKFDEDGWSVVEDTRSKDSIGGYLHVGRIADGDISADRITDKVRDNIIRYMYYVTSIVLDNPQKLPNIGATPQRQYMKDLSIAEREAIGNRSEQAYYA